jgi:hypothetical protein
VEEEDSELPNRGGKASRLHMLRWMLEADYKKNLSGCSEVF